MKKSLCTLLLFSLAPAFAWSDQNSTLIDTVIPSDAINAGHFGAALSVWGDLSVVGAPNADAVYVYRDEQNGSMTKIAKLTAPDGGSNSQFGYSVSMEGGILAVGAKWSDQGGLSNTGATYLYRIEQNGSVHFLQKIVPSEDDTADDNFGYSISVSDHFVAVGSPYHDHGGIVNAGSAYLYRVEQNGTVSYLSKVTSSDSNSSDKFGSSVSLSGNLLAVGAYDDDHAGVVDVGSAYLFQLEQNGSVTELGKVTASDSNASDKFGSSVSLSGNLLAVGAEWHDPNGLSSAGAAYLFRLEQNGSVSFLDKVKDGPAGAKLGFSLSLDEDLLAVGANQETHGGKSDAGAVYLYRVEQNGSATLLDRIVAQDANASDEFGSAVFLSDGVLAIGAPSTDYWGNTDAGTVFFYDVGPAANRAPIDIRSDPFLGFSQGKEELIHNLQTGWLKSAEDLVFNAYGWTVDSTDDWNVTVHEEHAALQWGRNNFSYAGGIANAVSIELVLSDLLSLLDLRLARGEVTKRVALVLLAQNSYYGDITGDGVSGGWWFKSGLARFLVGMDHGVLSLLGTEPTDAEIDALLAAVGDGETIQTEQQIAAAYLAVRYLDYKLRQLGHSAGIGQMTYAMKSQFDSGGGAAGSGINGYFTAMQNAGQLSFANNQAFLTDFKGVNGRNFILTQVLPTLENNDTGSVLGSDVTGGPALNALSVVPDLQGAPQSSVHYEIDEWADVLEFDEEEPVGTVVGKFNAVDPDDPQLGWKGYDLIDHEANISWTDAKAAADAANAADPFHWVYLATVTSEAEHNLTAHLVAQAGMNAWLGASDSAVEGEWRWTEGPEGEEGEEYSGQGLLFWQGFASGHSVNGLYENWLSSTPDNDNDNQHYLYLKPSLFWEDAMMNGTASGYLLESDQVLTHVYSLVSGYGDDNNNLFSLDPDGTLRTAAVFDYETHSDSYSVRVRVTDELNASFEKAFWVDLLDVDEDPDKDGLNNDVDLDDDGDGYSDAEEIAANSDPRNGWSLPPVTKVIYVDEDAEGENNGSSWTHAYDNLQAALAEADGANRTQVWVAEGVYRPDIGPGRTAGDRTASFQLKNRLEIIGGFQGHEQSVDERGSHGFITYLSGDIGGQNWPGDNSYHVVNASGVDRTAVLSDLGVVDGQADGPGQWDKRGAGILADNGSPSLRFIGFFNNHAAGTSNGGGALCVYNGGSPTVFSALFQSNSAEWGGAVKLSMGSSAVFYNTLFLGNQADKGGALVLWESNASITHSTMTENNASTGGALYVGSNSILAFDNSIAWGNQAAQQPSRYLSQSNLVAVHSVIEGGHGDLSDADPLFADPLHNDFRLRAGSPFVDAGDPAKVGVLAIDYHGISRSQDAAPDLGLFEGGADLVDLGGTISYSGVVDSGPFRIWLMDQSGFTVKQIEMPDAGPYSFVVERGHSYKVKAFRDANADGWPNHSDPWAYHHYSPIQINASRNDFDVHLEDAVAESNATVSGMIQYSGPVPGPVIVWVINEQGHYVREVVLPNGPGPYSVTLPKGAAYDLMAFRDGNGNGLLDAQKEVGEPFAHHGGWNSSTQSHDLIFVDGNLSGVGIAIHFHGDHDQDGITDWEEYIAGGGGYVSPQEHGLEQGLIRFYPLDGNASEEFDQQNNGVSHGTEPGPNRFGEEGMALFFDGEDDYVQLPSLELGSAYTLSAWVRPAEEKGGGYFNVLSNHGEPVWGVREGNLQQYFFGRVEGSAVERHAWTHLVLVRDGDFHTLYKNGQLDASAEVPADNDAFSVIGAYLPTAEALDDREPFHGSIDDLLVWERALTPAEVSLLNKFESERPEPHGHEGQYPGLHEPEPNDEEGLVPIVLTGLHRVGPEGVYEIEALILTEGSSPVLEVGVFLSRSVRGEYPRWVPAQLNEETLGFTVSVADLEPGARYYYRAYARNAAGENIGSLRKLETREDVPPGAWWSEMPKAEGGWRSSEWFGEFRMFGQTEWIFHSELGWVFVVPDEEHGLWLWHRELGWLWTEEGTWPHLWRNEVFDWLYFLRNHEGRPVLYDYGRSDYLILP